jgi:hypothetical protein
MSKKGVTKITATSNKRKIPNRVFSSTYMSDEFVLRINAIYDNTLIVDSEEKKLTTEMIKLYMENPNAFESMIATNKEREKVIYKLACFYDNKYRNSAYQMYSYYAFEYYKLFALSHIIELYKKPHKDRMAAFLKINKTPSNNNVLEQGPLFIALDNVIGYYGNTEHIPSTINYISKRSYITKLKICFVYILYNFIRNTQTGKAIINHMAINIQSETDNLKNTYKKLLDSVGITNIEPQLIPNHLAVYEQFKHIKPLVIAKEIPEVIDEQNYQNAVNYILQNSKTTLRSKFSKLL